MQSCAYIQKLIVIYEKLNVFSLIGNIKLVFTGGIKSRNKKKQILKECPLVTIITVVRNGEQTLEETIINVINQTYKNMEYIIIDGNSTDGTLNIIKKHEEKIDYWISEPDKGIYNAMNKGIDLATGEWINFMNSGDEFYSEATLEEIFLKENNHDSEIIYGDTLLVYDYASCIKKAEPLVKMLCYMPFTHQASFVKTQLLKAVKFNETYIISADYNFFYCIYLGKHIYFYTGIIIAKYNAEHGVSKNYDLTQREYARIQGIDKKPWYKIFLGINYFMYLFKLALKKTLPRVFVSKIRRWKNR